ncbi:MAG: Cell division protein FtsA [Thermoanaerobacterales bacterium 50_218]|nr:MAG: Cell division protein FtsA [Thermoanaerobacterales bacterium 50_218]HAA89512.1 ATPase [Peptococcaceae bacterium]
MVSGDSRMVFALDTGTRSIIGIVAEVTPDALHIRAAAREEHRGRAMLDGQIHDVNQVAKLVVKVKKQLEEQLGQSLRKVAVAAAGRVLKTVKGEAERDFPPWQEISEEEVRSLELEAVRAAERSLAENEKTEERFYCVGYSITEYRLNGEKIGNPVGQRGNSVGVRLIATFLPQVVVDSLIAVLERAGLEMEMMTLEPIAAIEAVIPPTMRHLNLALVDIGAGTSDIAVTSQGSVSAYAMVPLAGDEVTEKLCELYLLDFFVGEQVKRQLTKKKSVNFRDVLGIQHKVSSKEVVASLKETVNEIAREIGKTILELNQTPPQAVICIGGGSLTPGLIEELASVLGLSRERVAVRDTSAVRGIEGLSAEFSGPDGVTPLGIALMAAHPQGLGLSQVRVNDRIVRLFRGARATVADALLAAGIGFSELYGRPGLSLTVEVNGKVEIIKGSLGEPAKITLNGEPATLDTPLPPKATICVEEAKPGKDASAVVKDVLPTDLPSLRITFNGEPRELSPLIFMNGELVTPETTLVDRARVYWFPVSTVKDVLLALGYSEEKLQPEILRVTLNGEQKEVAFLPFAVYRNNRPVELSEEVKEGDQIELRFSEQRPRISDLLARENVQLPRAEVKVYVNGKPVTLTGKGYRVFKNEKEATLEEELDDGDVVEVRSDSDFKPIFADIFNHISFDRDPPNPAARLVTLLNGQEAKFTTPLRDGDKIRIFWKHENLLQNITPDERHHR